MEPEPRRCSAAGSAAGRHLRCWPAVDPALWVTRHGVVVRHPHHLLGEARLFSRRASPFVDPYKAGILLKV